MKNRIYACYCCNVHRDDLAKPNVLPCADCRRLGLQRPCYHTEVSDESLLDSLKEEVTSMAAEFPYLETDYPIRGSRIKSYRGTQVRNAASDDNHIDFDYTACSVTRRVRYIGLLKKELRLRGMTVLSEQPADLRLQLKELLITEERYKIIKPITEEANLERAMIKLEKAIPCLLHLENRSSEALLTHLLHRGLSIREGNRDECNQLMCAIEKLLNESVFGTEEAPSGWQFPVNPNNTMGEIKFANWRARRVISCSEQLINLCIPVADRDKWTEAFELYQMTIKVSSLTACFAWCY
jgi:hypothetical protein